MQLTGKEILKRGIVTQTCAEACQQQGVDVRISRICEVHTDDCEQCGFVPAQGKTKLPTYTFLEPTKSADGQLYWTLLPGYYEVQLFEGAFVPNNVTLHFKTRSSLVRCGALVHSGQFDAGFQTVTAGCFLQVLKTITIEYGARIAQAICFESEPVDNTYDGQWQSDKQRGGN